VVITGDVPQLAGELAVNAALRRLSPSGCRVATVRDDRVLVSFRWVCRSGRVVTATFSIPAGRRLVLGDLFLGGYRSYLSTTAAAQLQADGAGDPVTTDLSGWALTADALQVTFPAGTVSFPLVSLSSFVRRPGPLAP
jgi:hypothetical protein